MARSTGPPERISSDLPPTFTPDVTRARFLTALVALIAIGVVGAVVYLERTNVSTAAEAAITTSSTTSASTTSTSTTTSTTTLPPTTLPPTTLPPTTLPPTTLPPPERSTVAVVVSSASTTGARVRPTAYVMSAVGWSDIRDLNGSIPLVDTTIFYVDGFQNAAELFALDASLPITAVAPMTAAPPVAGLGNAQLLMYLGGS